MRIITHIVIVMSSYYILIHGGENYCFDRDTKRAQISHFTSKTAYQIIKGTDIEKQYSVPGCKSRKLWILHRHGTRLPNKKTIAAAPKLNTLREEILKNYRTHQATPADKSLCQEDLSALAMWKWNFSITFDQEQFLTPQGYEDLQGTAKIYQKYYRNVLTENYNRSYYKFRHTDTQRTAESFKAFTAGLFGSNNSAKADPIPELDLLLRPYDYCESWRIHDYSGIESESYRFKQSKIWKATIKDISQRLGFQYTLDSNDVELMWDMCRYEQAWLLDQTSVWCAAFTPEHVNIFEYEDDIKYYYKLGYGYEENTRLNCRMLQDMLTHLNNKTPPNVIAYFGHSSGIQTLITALGIAKDDSPLTAERYNRSERLWKTSNLDPFASNLLAVKYDCNSVGTEKDKVKFFLNQNVVDFDWCTAGLCNWSEVLKRYQTLYTANCNSYFCTGAGASSIVILIGVFSLVFIAYAIA